MSLQLLSLPLISLLVSRRVIGETIGPSELLQGMDIYGVWHSWTRSWFGGKDSHSFGTAKGKCIHDISFQGEAATYGNGQAGPLCRQDHVAGVASYTVMSCHVTSYV